MCPKRCVTAASEEVVEKLDADAVSFERTTGDMFASKVVICFRQELIRSIQCLKYAQPRN